MQAGGDFNYFNQFNGGWCVCHHTAAAHAFGGFEEMMEWPWVMGRRRAIKRQGGLLGARNFSPQQVVHTECEVIHAVCSKQNGTLEAEKLRRGAEAWAHTACCGLEVRAPGVFDLRRSIPKCPFNQGPFRTV